VERNPRIELLWWDGCPSWPQTLEDLRAAVEQAGLDPDAIEMREVMTDDAAEAERFVGSPTIRIDGADLQPPGTDEPFGLSCRIYRLRDGRISPTPDPADLRDALERATEHRERSGV
jgi:alkanesulfonate monooxygenase SsuD/methylene tetrahydromethanopterin reductase-like flavin-dependent oxidoreductase (luciferase family)